VVDFDALVRNYNLVTFGNASFGGGYGDTHGPLAVQGNLSLSGGSIAAQPGTFGVSSDPTLYVGGSLTLTGGTTYLSSGYASLNSGLSGSWDGTQRQLTTGGGILSSINSGAALAAADPRTNPAPSGWNWASLQSQAAQISSTLAAATATGSVQINGQTLSFVAPQNATGVVVFNFDASLLSGNSYNGQMFTNVSFNVPTNDLFVVNVTNITSGQTLLGTSGGINFNQGSGYERLLWNILPSAGPTTSVSLGNGGQFFGSVLAPLVDLGNTNNTAVNGQIVSASYTHSGAELHYTGFDASGITFSAVPEPSTYALAALGLCVVGAIWHRRRSAAPGK
jgi:choice-of-anchor A domain-containing protein